MERVIRKYMEVTTRNDVFARYEKEFACRIVAALSGGYHGEWSEPRLVQLIEEAAKAVGDFVMRDGKAYLELSTKSIFVHGNKSHVLFDYYGRRTRRELGDLILIISLVFNGQKYFEKFTISQFKRDKPKSGKAVRWNVRGGNSGKEQLYLLSRFPSFAGTGSSLIPKAEYTLPNYSGCLGSYGLLYRPGDFIFISATKLDSLIGQGSSVKMSELAHLEAAEPVWPCVPWLCSNIDEAFYLMGRLQMHSGPTCYFPWGLLGNHHYARNAFDFARKYLTLAIGEPIFMKVGIDNPCAKALFHAILSAVRIKAKRSDLPNLLSFVEDFFRYGYSDDKGQGIPAEEIDFDFEGGGIGIIHTVINLGE